MTTCRWEDWPPGTTSFAVGTGIMCSKPARWRQRGCGSMTLCDEHFNGTVAWWRERNYDLAADYEPIPPAEPSKMTSPRPLDLVGDDLGFVTRLRRRRLWGEAGQEYVEILDLLIVCERCNTTIKDSSPQGGSNLESTLRTTETGRSALEAQLDHYNKCVGLPNKPVSPSS